MESFGVLSKKLPFLYWWSPGKRFRVIPRPANVGDALNIYIVDAVMKELGVTSWETDSRLFAIGSVLNHARDGDIVWGTGYNSIHGRDKYSFNHLDVRSVRGPLTRRFLSKMGVQAPEIYGDPGILASRYFPVAPKKYDYIVIPHYSEPRSLYKGHEVLETKGDVVAFMDKLTSARFVVSSSLHGIILAESFGIPAVFLQADTTERIEKYCDYYQGTGRESFPVAGSVSEALSVAPVQMPDLDAIQERLLQVFPRDFNGREMQQ